MFGHVTRVSLVDAYIQVSVFVAATLVLFYSAEKVFNFDLHTFFRQAKLYQVPVAAFLGMLPGCGGAIIVVAAYSSGSISMGAVVAALTATMGDAAFLLIAKRPDAAIVLLPTAWAAGILAGYVIDLFDHSRFDHHSCESQPASVGKVRWRDLAYGILAVPGLVVGVMALAQVEFTGVFHAVANLVGLTGIALGVLIWVFSPIGKTTSSKDSPITRMSEETSFITIWVVLAFLMFEYLDQFAGLNLAVLFETIAVILPLIAIVVGFIPGCGPQVLVTTLYINGLIPFAALVGNAISNDGDALFPAIAINPRAAVLATLYSAVPAVLVAYGFYFLLPNFL